MVVDFDDFGCNRIISDMCQSHDCRDKLDELHYVNPNFRVTLFAIPYQMTPELLEWSDANKTWVELGVHGFAHDSNYECEKITYEEFVWQMKRFKPMIEQNFVKIFRAPGWQISDDAFRWLSDNNWIVADQGYNDMRRPIGLRAYVNYDGVFKADGQEIEAYHGHTWDVGWNGIYEDFDRVRGLVESATEFKFVSELF